MNEYNNTTADFFARDLVSCILTAEAMEKSARDALYRMGELIVFHSCDSSGKKFIFDILNEPLNSVTIGKIVLEVLRGSVYTFIWSTFARFDDEYVLYHVIGDEKRLLWRVKGVDAVNAKITDAEVDWFQIRSVLNMMRIRSIGVLAFGKLLGRLFLSLPYYYKKREYIAPMPVTFMFNYMMVVHTCPFVVTAPDLASFLESGKEFKAKTNKSLIVDLMRLDGSGAVLHGYFPFQMRNNRKCLLHSSILHSSNPPPSSSSSTYSPLTVPTQFTASSSSSSSQYSASDVLTPLSVGKEPHQIAWSERDSKVRAVELVEHPAGDNGLVLLVELVHARNWSENTRFVVLDVYAVCQALNPTAKVGDLDIDSAEGDARTSLNNDLAKSSQQIHILDERDWNELLQQKGYCSSDTGYNSTTTVTSTLNMDWTTINVKSEFEATKKSISSLKRKKSDQSSDGKDSKVGFYNRIDFKNSPSWGSAL